MFESHRGHSSGQRIVAPSGAAYPKWKSAHIESRARISFAVKSPEVFYLHINGEQRGPYTIQHVDHLLNSGLIAENTLFWREGMEQWLPVTQLVARRKRVKRWIRPAIPLAIVAILAIFLRIFGPITLDGWRESSQTAFTQEAAYWRARDFVRHTGVPPGTVVQFLSINRADVQLEPPDAAIALVQGKVIEPRGASRKGAWRVRLAYDNRRKEWTNRGIEEVPPPSS